MRNFLLSLVLFSCVLTSRASHVIGGSLTYKCLGNGQFRFTLVMYRDCVGMSWNQNTVQLQGPVGGNLFLVSSEDISPRCATAPQFACSPVGGAQGTAGTTSKFTYAGTVNLSNLGPAPLNGGYTFFVTFPCCRNSSSNMIGSELGLQVKMLRYTHPITGQAVSPAELCDNSPEFLVDPTTVLGYNENDTARLQNLAVDADGDLVVHQIDYPLNNFLVPYAYIHPYSATAPLPGMVGAPAVDPQHSPIHRVLGEVVIRPTVVGNFVCVVRADGYRNGQLVSQTFRDVSLRILPNSPTFPIQPSTILFAQKAPQIDPPVLKAAGGRRSFEWDFYAGDSIELYFSATDIFPALVGIPDSPSTWQPSNEALQLAMQGGALSTSNQVNAGCANPPCATLTNSLQPALAPSLINFGNGQFMGNGYQFATQGNVKLGWVPGCTSSPPRFDSVPNLVHSYGFMVRSADRNCVMQGRTDRAMVIRVRSKPIILAPEIANLRYDTLDGRYRFQWVTAVDTLTPDTVDVRNWTGLLSPQAILDKSVARRRASFDSYRIYRSVNGGAWQLAGRLINPFTTSFIDTMRLLNSHEVAYQLRTVSSCERVEIGSQVIRSAFLATSVSQHRLSRLVLAPNPGNAWYTISGNGRSLPEVLELRDLQGRLIRVFMSKGEERLEFDLSDLPASVYLLQNAEGTERIKLVHRPL